MPHTGKGKPDIATATGKHCTAIIWDYDGTLVDTRLKNLNVTRRIVRQITGTDHLAFDALQEVEGYVRANRRWLNWREFYRMEFGMDEEQIDTAGRMWTPMQDTDSTPTPMYDGLRDLILDHGLHPHGVVSQNSRSNIEKTLDKHGVLPHFRSIIGYEEVDIRAQKPEPVGLVQCIRELTSFAPGLVLYVGDHETDIRCARNAAVELQAISNDTDVISVGVAYSHESDTPAWETRPDHEARTVAELAQIIHTYR